MAEREKGKSLGTLSTTPLKQTHQTGAKQCASDLQGYVASLPGGRDESYTTDLEVSYCTYAEATATGPDIEAPPGHCKALPQASIIHVPEEVTVGTPSVVQNGLVGRRRKTRRGGMRSKPKGRTDQTSIPDTYNSWD